MNTLSLSFVSLLLSPSFLTFFQFPRLSALRLYIASVRILLMKLSGNKQEVDTVCCACFAKEGRSLEEEEVIQTNMESCVQTT
jgi:hypothetical protein